VDFDNYDITVTHIDENGLIYILCVFYEEHCGDEIDEDFIALLKDSSIKFNWIQVTEGKDIIFDGWRFRELDDMTFEFIINGLEEVVKKKNEEKIRLEDEEENKLKYLAKKFGILQKSS